MTNKPDSHRRKEYMREYQREWMRKRRDKYLGGKLCEWCGSQEKMNIHHTDPTTKVHHAIWSWKESRIVEELAKCEIICEECHIDHHANERRRHGIQSYQRGCRCAECRAAKSVNNKRYRDKSLAK